MSIDLKSTKLLYNGTIYLCDICEINEPKLKVAGAIFYQLLCYGCAEEICASNGDTIGADKFALLRYELEFSTLNMVSV